MKPAILRKALAGTAVETRYQPIVRLADRVPAGVEALARLTLPRQGTLPPDDFVPHIEDAGLAAEFTDIIAALALNDHAAPELARHNLTMSLNFPLGVLLIPAALERLEQRRRHVNIPAARIIIELTESTPVDDLPALRRAIDDVRAAGYGLAIDDIIPSTPHLERLIEMPFTALKLDKTVVQGTLTQPAARDFAARIVARGKSRGLTVIAEGVEDEETWAAMRALGVDQAQGFLISHPLTAQELPGWLAAWRARE